MSTATLQTSGELAHEMSRHTRLLHMLRARMASWVPAGLDGAAFGLLMGLVKCGPARQVDLAELSLLDPSTVSRYVAQLVKAGYVTRRPDPGDGRAVQLVATDAGREIGATAATRREELVRQLLAGWSEDDARTLVGLLRRFNDDLEARREGPAP